MIIVGFDSSEHFAKKLAKLLGAKYTKVQVSTFPDKETYLGYKINLRGQHIVLVNSLYFPNNKIIKVAFAAATAKDLGAKKVTLISPYMPYIRQDKRFKKGECISSKIFPKLLIGVDEFITVDPHLHRYKSLNQIFKIKTKALTSNTLIAQYIKKHFKDAVLIGPDKESYQWDKKISKIIKAKSAILKKTRLSPKKVKITSKISTNLKGKDIVIIDDIISTGNTAKKTIELIKKQHPSSINVICVHGLFLGHSIKKLKKAGADTIVSTNTIPSKYSKIDITPLFKKEVK